MAPHRGVEPRPKGLEDLSTVRYANGALNDSPSGIRPYRLLSVLGFYGHCALYPLLTRSSIVRLFPVDFPRGNLVWRKHKDSNLGTLSGACLAGMCIKPLCHASVKSLGGTVLARLLSHRVYTHTQNGGRCRIRTHGRFHDH